MHRLSISIEAFGIQGPEAYSYTSLSNCLEVEGIDDTKDFADTLVGLIDLLTTRPNQPLFREP